MSPWSCVHPQQPAQHLGMAPKHSILLTTSHDQASAFSVFPWICYHSLNAFHVHGLHPHVSRFRLELDEAEHGVRHLPVGHQLTSIGRGGQLVRECAARPFGGTDPVAKSRPGPWLDTRPAGSPVPAGGAPSPPREGGPVFFPILPHHPHQKNS